MKFWFTLILIMQFFFALGQSKKRKSIPPPPPPLSDTLNEISGKTNYTLYKAKKRQAFYPFSKATQIQIVSFDKQLKERIRLKNIGNDSYEMSDFTEVFGLPIQADTIDFSKISQVISLSKNEIDSLTDILYNTCSRWTLTQTSKAGCYYPHNAIIFLNNKNQVFEFIELCFDCNQLQYSSKKIKKFEDCDITFSELEAYFKLLGLKTSGNDFDKK